MLTELTKIEFYIALFLTDFALSQKFQVNKVDQKIIYTKYLSKIKNNEYQTKISDEWGLGAILVFDFGYICC